jgi:hypothetical protein
MALERLDPRLELGDQRLLRLDDVAEFVTVHDVSDFSIFSPQTSCSASK